jgi:hypothetical protein
MKILIVDTYYPDFLKTLPSVVDYASGLDYALSRMFGTFDAYSRNLRGYGHDVVDIIANHEALQKQWARERDWSMSGFNARPIVLKQIEEFSPDIVFLQDLSFFSAAELFNLRRKYLLAGQLSCAFEDDEKLKLMDVLLTSFPFYVSRFEQLGVRAEFLPLAFDPLVLERAQIPTSRTYSVSFVGGYGRHWKIDDLFARLAAKTPIQFWGYGYESAPTAIRERWRGQAWGIDMYEIYLRSHIVINRHGGISRGLSNNLRLFEATGCGSLLLTEHSENIGDYFASDECALYSSIDDAVDKIENLLSRSDELLRVAANGQRRTLNAHTYAQRMKRVSEALTECFEHRAVSA